MRNTVEQTPVVAGNGSLTAFSAPVTTDGVTVITATRTRTLSLGRGEPAPHARTCVSRPVGAFVVTDGQVRWHPTVDVTRLVASAQLVVGAVLLAHRLSRRPSATKAHVTMGPGSWVSMKGGSVAVRPGSRPWGRPRPLPRTSTAPKVPIWARTLSAVPLQWLTR
jgi:hypothetical protein